MKHTKYDLDTCLDIFDWFDDPDYEYIIHIVYSKLDGEQRIAKALPEIQKHARELVNAHRGFEDAYPELNIPA